MGRGIPLLFCTFALVHIEQSAPFLREPIHSPRSFIRRRIQLKFVFAPNSFRRRTQSPLVSLAASPKDDEFKGGSLKEDVDDDFSSWVSSNLKQWPLVSSSSVDELDDLQQTSQSKRGTKNDVPESALENVNMTPLKRTPTLSEQQQSSFWQIWNLEALLNLTMTTTSSILGESLGSSATKQIVLDDTKEVGSSGQDRIDSMENVTAAALAPRDWTTLEDIAAWNKFFRGSEKSSSGGSSSNVTKVSNQTLFETWVRQATARVESLVSDASAVLSPEAIEKLISTRAAAELLETAKRIALDRGMNVSIAARESASFARSFFQAADASMEQGRLFEHFETVSQLLDSDALTEAGKMGALSGAIYEDTVPRARQLGESIVARGTTKDVVWMVTDGHHSDGLVRTITIRGYDASDEEVDREQLLNNICTALPEQLKSSKGLKVHSGMLAIAREIYRDVKGYIDWMAPNHKLVVNGHSVGGSLSLLVLLLMVNDLGIDFVKKSVRKVYMFGSPPVLADPLTLEKYEIPQDMVHGYVQPWDPIVRLFSSIDALYPLVSDLGADDSTPFAE